jgi:hypothetical protein
MAIFAYPVSMAIDPEPMIIPADFPELALIVWSRDASRPIAAAEVFAIYERNWRFVDRSRLTSAETALIRDLTERFGHGELLVAE